MSRNSREENLFSIRLIKVIDLRLKANSIFNSLPSTRYKNAINANILYVTDDTEEKESDSFKTNYIESIYSAPVVPSEKSYYQTHNREIGC